MTRMMALAARAALATSATMCARSSVTSVTHAPSSRSIAVTGAKFATMAGAHGPRRAIHASMIAVIPAAMSAQGLARAKLVSGWHWRRREMTATATAMTVSGVRERAAAAAVAEAAACAPAAAAGGADRHRCRALAASTRWMSTATGSHEATTSPTPARGELAPADAAVTRATAATAAAPEAAAPSAATRDGDERKDPPGWVRMLNTAISDFPFELVAAYIALDILSIVGMHQLLLGVGYEAPADFALAFAVSRLLRRPRLPIDLAAAGIIAKAYPPLTQVHITRVFKRIREDRERAMAAGRAVTMSTPNGGTFASGAASGGEAAVATATNLAATSAAASEASPPQQPTMVARVVTAGARLIDRYGLAFLVSQRMVVGLASVFSIYAALHAGVDVQAWMNANNLPLGKVAGTWAAAACCAAALFPGVVLGAGALAPRIAATRHALWGKRA